MDELVQALDAYRGTFPRLHKILYEIIKHLNHDAVIKLPEVYNKICNSQTFPNSWHTHIIPTLKRVGDPKSVISFSRGPPALTTKY